MEIIWQLYHPMHNTDWAVGAACRNLLERFLQTRLFKQITFIKKVHCMQLIYNMTSFRATHRHWSENPLQRKKRTFEEFVTKLEYFVQRVKTLCREHSGKKIGKWMDNREVCHRLHINPRTLQDYRNNGILPYTQVGSNILYRDLDIERTLMKGYKKAYRYKRN